MSDKILYKGKVYGNTLATKMTTVLQEPDEKEADGTYVYIIPEDEQLSTVQIAGGGRVKYGSADSNTIICQGLKMTKKLSPISNTEKYNGYPREEAKAGLCLPTDLYTNFDLDFCSIINNDDDDNTKHGPIKKNYSIICPVVDDDYLYLCLDSKDTYKTGTMTNVNLGDGGNVGNYLKKAMGPTSDTVIGNYLGSQGKNNVRSYGLLAYNDISSLSNTSLTIRKRDNVTYAGVYFLVNNIHGVGDLYGWNNKSKKWEIKYQNGYATVFPIFVRIRELKNKYPTFYIVGENKQFSLTKNTKIDSQYRTERQYFCKYNNEYFYYNAADNIWVKKEGIYSLDPRIIWYLGDAQEDPLTSVASELKMNTETHDVYVKDVYKGLFSKEISGGFISIEEVTSLRDIKENGYWSWNTNYFAFTDDGSNTDGAFYVEKQNEGNFTVYVYVSFTPLGPALQSGMEQSLIALPIPFKNKAELNFALGIREELQYIDENTYMVYSIADKIVNEHKATYWDGCPEKYRGQLQVRLVELYSQYVAYNSYDYNNIIMTFGTTSIEDAVNEAIINALVDKVLNTGTTIDDIEKIPNLPQDIINEVKKRVGGNE